MEQAFNSIDLLCAVCSRLDFRSLFQYGLQGPPLRKWVEPQDRPEPLYLGYLSEIAVKSHCPFCRLVRHCSLLEYPNHFTPEFRLQASGEEVPCRLDTITVSENWPDLEEPAGAGPPAWYIGFHIGDLRRNVRSQWRYLLIDEKDAPPVDKVWDIPRSPVAEEESQINSIRVASPHLKGLPKVYFYSGRKVGQQVDFKLLKSWMKYCEDKHTGCKGVSEEALSKISVIDVHKRSVVKPPPGCRYVALSYVWGSNNIVNATALSAKLPQTIEDAIIAVKELGESYLWVDALCIAQDDPYDKTTQIQNMDQIYSNAVVMFVAGEGSDSNAGLPGVRPGSRSSQQYAEVVDGLSIYVSTPLLKESISPFSSSSSSALSTRRWSNRGWTFQEGLLSTRCLIFTANQVFWKCMSEFCCESIAEALDHQRQWVGGLKNSEIFASNNLVRGRASDFFIGTNCHYFELVQAFSQRRLTFDNDRLDAFAGLAKAIERRGGSGLFWGLPEDIFDHGLLWIPTTIDSLKSRNRYFPTWSWASWPGAVTFPNYVPERLDGTWMDKWDLRQGTLCVRRKHSYWKFYSDGTPEKINQKYTRYSMETEGREGIVTETGGVSMIMDKKTLFDGREVTDAYIEEADME